MTPPPPLYPGEHTEETPLAYLRPDDTVIVVNARGVVYHIGADHVVVSIEGEHRRVEGERFCRVVLAD